MCIYAKTIIMMITHPTTGPTCIISQSLSLTGEGIMVEKCRCLSKLTSEGLQREAGLKGEHRESLPREETLSEIEGRECTRMEGRGWDGAGKRSNSCIIIKSTLLSSMAFW